MIPFATAVEDYLRLRRAFGHELRPAARLLPRFAEHLDAVGAEFITIDAALLWSLAAEAAPGSNVRATRMSVVRGFARYMAGIDPRTEIPPAGLIRFRRCWRTPFLYSEQDVAALMAQARRSIRPPLRAATLETLIGLLAATGMRVGEAIRLDRSEIDWSEGVLLVERSKFNKSRQVPLQASTLQALSGYARERDRLCPEPCEQSFFVSPRGTRPSYPSVRRAFRSLCMAAGVGAGSTLQPRIHGLRHSFAVNTLVSWYRDGLDVQARLPWLSTYLGHREPRSTYIYLSAAPQLLAYAARLREDAEAVAL